MASNMDRYRFFATSSIHGKFARRRLFDTISFVFPVIALVWYGYLNITSKLGICAFTLGSILFGFFMVLCCMRLIITIWCDIFAALNKTLGSPTMISEYPRFNRADDAPLPASARLHLKANPMINDWHSMYQSRIYLRHYQRHQKQNESLERCSLCISDFTDKDLYGNTWDSELNQQTSPNVFITQCGHMFHRHCLWKWWNTKDPRYWYFQHQKCPYFCQKLLFDYFTGLFEPQYVEENYFLLSMMDITETSYNFQYSLWENVCEHLKRCVTKYLDLIDANSSVFGQTINRPNYYL